MTLRHRVLISSSDASTRRRGPDVVYARDRDRRVVPVRHHAAGVDRDEVARRRPAATRPATCVVGSLFVVDLRVSNRCTEPLGHEYALGGGCLRPATIRQRRDVGEELVHRLRPGVRDDGGAVGDRGRRQCPSLAASGSPKVHSRTEVVLGDPWSTAYRASHEEDDPTCERAHEPRHVTSTYYLILAAMLSPSARSGSRPQEHARDVHVHRADAQRREPPLVRLTRR